MNPTWTVHDEVEVEGKLLVPGTTFKCKAERGKTYRFTKYVTTEEGAAWVDCYGGSSGREQSRSVRLDSIAPDSIKKPKKVE